MLGAFLLLSVVPLAAVGVLVYRQGQALLQQELWNRLTAVALLKGQQIQAWVRERQNDVVRPASLETFQRRLAALVDRAGTADGVQAEREIRQILERLRATGEFTEMFVIEPRRARVLVSTDPGQEGKFKRDRPYFREGRRGPHVQHVYYSVVLDRPVMAFSAPVVDPGGRLLAILVARVDLRFLDRLMSERSGLGSTGQTFLVNRFNHFVSDSFGRGESGWRPVFSEGVTRALAGTSGTAAYVNHAARRVVGAYRWIPALDLALIAEMHEDEGFAAIRTFRLMLIAVLGLIAGVAVVVGAGLSYGIARPIARLGEAARVIGEGRLDQRVEVKGPAELAMLGQSFNSMAESLGALQGTLRRRVTDRTQELMTLNELAELTAGAQTVETLLDHSLERLLRLLESEVGVAFLVDNGTLTLAAHQALPPDVVTDLTARPLKTGQGIVGEVAASGRLILLDEFSRDPRVLRSGVRDLGIRGFVAFPLLAKGRVLGVLGLGTSAATPVPADRLTFLEVLGTQLGAVIENLRLFAASERRREAAEALARVGRSLTQSLDCDVLAQQVVESVCTLFKAEMSVIYGAEPESEDLVLLAGVGPTVDWNQRLPRGTATVGRAVVERRPIVTADVLNDPDVQWAPEHRARIERSGYRAVLAVPLVTQDRVIGALAVGDWLGRVFDENDTHLAQAFADQAAIALENARLYRQAEERAERLRTLSMLTRLITAAAEDSREVYDAVARAAITLLGARLARIWVSDSDALLRTEGIFSDDPALVTEAARSATISHGYGATGEAFRTLEPQYFADVQRDPRFLNHAWTSEAGLHAAALVPLIAGQDVLGVLSIFFGARPPFTDEEKDLMRLLADQAAIVIAKSRLYNEARQTLVELEGKNAELDSFVYSVSHDLKAPLVAIQGMAGALVEDFGGELDDRGRHYLARLQANVEQMEQLIQDLLALSRLERESRPAEAVNLAEVVDDVISELAEPIGARGIKVVVRDAPTVWGIRRQVEQVMANLLGNAVKYIGDTESPVVEVGAIDRDELVECYVRDNGVGIDPAYHEKIFEIFQRLNDIEAEGTGIGLAIVKKVVEGAGGRVWVESTKGQGATFRFTWPAKPGREPWNGTKR